MTTSQRSHSIDSERTMKAAHSAPGTPPSASTCTPWICGMVRK
jgi:hypothetical protein